MSPAARSDIQVTIRELYQNQPTDEFDFSNAQKVAGRGGGALRFFGTISHQNQYAFPTFDAFLKRLEDDEPAARIIELGTGCGGLSVFLQIYALTQNIDFVTYDDDPYNPDCFPVVHTELFSRLEIDIRGVDIFEAEQEIADEITKDGVTVLLCDACKSKEFNLFSPYLKLGDYIMCHDYAPDRHYWEEHMDNQLWSTCDIVDDDIATACYRHNLVPFMHDEFLRAAWCCKKKV